MATDDDDDDDDDDPANEASRGQVAKPRRHGGLANPTAKTRTEGLQAALACAYAAAPVGKRVWLQPTNLLKVQQLRKNGRLLPQG